MARVAPRILRPKAKRLPVTSLRLTFLTLPKQYVSEIELRVGGTGRESGGAAESIGRLVEMADRGQRGPESQMRFREIRCEGDRGTEFRQRALEPPGAHQCLSQVRAGFGVVGTEAHGLAERWHRLACVARLQQQRTEAEVETGRLRALPNEFAGELRSSGASVGLIVPLRTSPLGAPFTNTG